MNAASSEENSSDLPGESPPSGLETRFPDFRQAIADRYRFQPEAGGDASSIASGIDKLANDILQLRTQLQGMEGALQAISQQVFALHQSADANAQTQWRELTGLQQALQWDRRAGALVSVFEAVISPLEQFRHMRAGLNPKKDQKIIAQLEPLVVMLERILRSLGFEEFAAVAGEAFDPYRMQCLGYGKGAAGVVLKPVRSGYRAGALLVRPAGVMIADPAAESVNSGESKT